MLSFGTENGFFQIGHGITVRHQLSIRPVGQPLMNAIDDGPLVFT